MADFNKAIKKVLASEGGYSNDPDDIGRESYCGISRKFWPNWNGWEHIDSFKRNQFKEGVQNNYKFKSLSLSNLVQNFYLKYFWKPLKCEQILNQSLAESVFDYAVNVGKKPAARSLQELVNAWTKAENRIKIDGIIGPASLKLINNKVQEYSIIPNDFIAYRIKEYFDRCSYKPVKYKYLRGWVMRSLKHLER